MKRKPKFKIGDWVEFHNHCVVDYEKVDVNMYKKSRRVLVVKGSGDRRVGQIVGAIIRYEGIVEPSSGSWDDYEPGYLNVKNSKILWQVRTGYLNKPYEVLEEDLKFCGNDNIEFKHCKKLPWKDIGYNELARKHASYSMKELYRRTPENFPRDSKGRFCK